MVLLSAVYITEKFGCTKDFCDRHGLRYKAMQEIRKLRRQLTNELTRTANLQIVLDPNSETPGTYFDFDFIPYMKICFYIPNRTRTRIFAKTNIISRTSRSRCSENTKRRTT